MEKENMNSFILYEKGNAFLDVEVYAFSLLLEH